MYLRCNVLTGAKVEEFRRSEITMERTKKMPLIKPMVGCASDGYILFVLGPFDATHNDATILKDCFNRYEEILAILRENDVIFIDNGFRDVIEDLKQKKLVAYIPGTGKRDALEANKSR